MPKKSAPSPAKKPSGASSGQSIDPQRLIALIPIRPHETLADIGCGAGDLAIPLAKYVFDGKVYAVDTDPEALKQTTERALEIRLGNVHTVLSKPTKVPLDSESLDGIVLANVLHEASRPGSLLKEVARMLRPGGWAAVIEWAEEGDGDGPPAKQRLSREKALDMAADVGLRRLALRNVDDHRYLLVLHK